MGYQTLTASANEVIAVEPVIRRVIATRATNAADIDDLVQDCLERLLKARQRLAPEAVLPYAVVTARNLVSSHAKSAIRDTAAAPRILDAAEPERPDEVLLAGEARDAMAAALARLSGQERRDLLAYYSDGSQGATTARESPGALRVRMARTRAKLRLEYLLAFRHLTLPSATCRTVLMAISAGDTRRQRELDAGQHLLDCETCATLSEPLGRRSVALTAIAIPVGLAAWAAGKARAHPVQAAATAAAASAAVVAGVLGPQLSHPGRAPTAHVRVSPAPVSAAVIGHLSVAGQAVSDAQARQSLRALIGRPAAASGATVVAAVTRNGFWIGSSQGQIWVELVGPLRPLNIQRGDRVRFTGAMAANSPSFPVQAGMSDADAALLARQGAHLIVSTARITVAR
ncbi:MAG: sigma-70 family RNA polymerase sigma factor [Streptosporangiaceae bacterium]|nr:sigma-70 family RNA polymerase sigma factor [Streptosporangiaceae bacterium]